MRRLSRTIPIVSVCGMLAACLLGGALYAYSSAAQSSTPDTAVPQTADDTPLMTQARSVGIKSCLSPLREATRPIGTDYAVYSTAAPTTPDAHIFQSVLSIAQADDPKARSLGLLLAAPTSLGCETAAVQVLPLAMSCDALQAARKKKGAPMIDFNGLYSGDPRSDLRQVFIPAGPGACIAVSMSVAYANK